MVNKKIEKEFGLFYHAVEYLFNNGLMEDFNWTLILDTANRARKILDKYPALQRAWLENKPLSPRIKCYYRKINLL